MDILASDLTTKSSPQTSSFRNIYLLTTLQALVVISLVMILKKIKSSSRNKKLHPLPPGPTGFPIVGMIPAMLKNRPVFRWLHSLMKELNTEIAYVRLGNTHVIPVTCSKIAREMFKQQDALFASRPLTYAQKILSNGYKTCVITPFGEQFKKMRKVIMTEIVCPARHRWLHDNRAEETDHLTAWLHNMVKNSEPVDLRFFTRHYCGNAIERLMFGTRTFSEKTETDGGPTLEDIEHMDAMFEGLGFTFAFGVSDYLPMLTGLDLNGHEKIMREASAMMDKYPDPIIDERIKMWREGKRTQIEDFLDIFISIKDEDDQPWDIESLEKILNYKFKDKSLLMQAFTEASYVGEECNSYEVLELLGDAVLHMVITIELVNLYPQESAGQLTKLRAVNVDTEKLARVAVKHKLYRYIRHKKPLLEEQILEYVVEMEKYPLHSYGLLNVPKSLANIVESTIGALFKDCNSIETVWKVMKPLLEPIIPIDKLQNHPVTELNELCQKRHLNLTHHDSWNTNKTYYFLINDKLVGCGHHHKKYTARSCAAKNALDNLPYFFPCPSVS